MAKAKAKGTKSGRPIGRPGIPQKTRLEIRRAYNAGGVGMRAVAKQFDRQLGNGAKRAVWDGWDI